MLWRLKFWLGFISLSLFVLTLAITLTINSTWLYQLNVYHGDFLPLVNLTARQMLHNFDQLLSYLNYPWVQELKMTNFSDSPAGITHFREVKQLFMVNYGIMIISLVISICYLRFLRQKNLSWLLIRPLQVIFAGVFTLIGLMLMGFDQFFIQFHKLLFANNDWQFYPVQDPIINALPESYFYQCFALCFSLLIIFLALIYYWAQRPLRK